jgi:LPXTG-motif cell wall-anchored protein
MVAQQTNLTGRAPAPIALAANEPIFFAMFVTAPARPTVAEAVAEALPASLPETGSSLPLVGLLGVLALGSFVGLRAIRVTV